MSLASRRHLLSLILGGAAAGLAACTAPSAPPMPGTSAGAAPDDQLSRAASAVAGQNCPATSQGLPRVVTRGEGPVVLHQPGTARGTTQRGGAQRPPQEGDSCP